MTAAAYGRETSTAEILALADSLGEVIDDLHVAGVPPSALRDLEVSQDLAANWQKALKVLEIVARRLAGEARRARQGRCRRSSATCGSGGRRRPCR